MTGFIIADLEEAGAGCVWVTEECEGSVVEDGDALLVERVDDPFCCEEILEEEVVWARVIGGGWEDDGFCFVGWVGVCGVAVGAVVRGLA